MTFFRIRVIGGILAALLWVGCAGKAPIVSRPVVPAPPVQPIGTDARVHLEGIWENPGRAGKTKQLIFEPGGVLKFEGGLGYFNPAQWVLDPDRRELTITLPQAEDDKLQIFKLYVGDGVKAFDRVRKQITYAFDEKTWTLNVGGWMFSKVDRTTIETQPEPVFK